MVIYNLVESSGCLKKNWSRSSRFCHHKSVLRGFRSLWIQNSISFLWKNSIVKRKNGTKNLKTPALKLPAADHFLALRGQGDPRKAARAKTLRLNTSTLFADSDSRRTEPRLLVLITRVIFDSKTFPTGTITFQEGHWTNLLLRVFLDFLTVQVISRKIFSSWLLHSHT
jgi:hypothetical protein